MSGAMNTVYAAMLRSDGSVGVNYFTLRFGGTVTKGETPLDFAFKGAFDISEVNRENDTRTQLSLEVKQGGIEKLAFYVSEGKAYLHFPPYALYARISDFNFAKVVYELYSEKKNGTIKRVADMLPEIASRIFNGCRYFSENGIETYRFFLSYEQLFDSFSSLVAQADAGVSPAELSDLFSFDADEIARLTETEPYTAIDFVLSEGVFLSAKAQKEGSGSIELTDLSLKSGTDALEMPASLSAFNDFNPLNFSLSGKAQIKTAVTNGDKTLHYGVTLNADYDAISYPFDYEIKTNYVSGQGVDFSVKLTDPNGKKSAFDLRGETLYADLSAYGIAKFKLKTSDLSEKLALTGFKDTDEYTFKDKLRLLALLVAGRKANGDVIRYELGADFFSVFSEKIGFLGLFGVDGASFSWDTRNNRLQDFSASVSLGSMTFALSAPTFTFGSPVTLPSVSQESEYADLSARTSTRVRSSGTMLEQTSFKSDGEFLSALLSSLGGEEVSLSAEGGLSYSSDIAYGASGAISRAFVQFYASSGSEVVKLYYTAETKENFYLIYPESAGVRPVRTLTLAEDPFAAFNEASGVTPSGNAVRLYFRARENAFTVEANAGLARLVREKLSILYPDLSLAWINDVAYRRLSLRITENALNATVVFDSDNELYVNANSFSLSFNEEFSLVSLDSAVPERIYLLSENDMPVYAEATFTDNVKYRLSLLAYGSEERVWTYAGVPTGMGLKGASTSVTASAALLGKSVEKKIAVDVSPATDVALSGGAAYASKYDVTEKKFTFDLYNDVSPSTVLSSYDLMMVDVDGTMYVKDVTWDMTGVSTASSDRNFTVRPRVKTYFGNEIFLGGVANFTLSITGGKAKSTDYSLTFVAYDGKDPLNASVYSDVLNVTTEDGRSVTVETVGWDLTNSNVEARRQAGTLYEYKTDPAQPDKVKAKVFDLMGGYVVLEIPIYFEPKVVHETSFDVSSLDGVSYDAAERTFKFDVLKVRTFSSASSERILPTSLIANEGEADEFVVNGIKWEFESLEGVVNASGAQGELTLLVGDSISGYQTKRFAYLFDAIEITEVSLLDENESEIQSKTEDMFSYEFTSLSAYNYRYPSKIKVTFAANGGTESEILPAKWAFDKAFEEDALCAGGVYVGTTYVGSETVRLTMAFDQMRITGYGFTPDQLSIGGGNLTIEGHQGKDCLTYSVLCALDPTLGFDYTSKESYPSEILVRFNGGAESVAVSVDWDLSSFRAKEDIIGNGFFGTVNAIAKGQKVEVYVYVAPAVGDYDSVYTKEDKSSRKVTFRLMTPKDGGYTVTDPRDVKNFPDTLYIESAGGSFYPISVLSWDLGDGLNKLYTQGLSAGASANEISGNVNVKARIGSEKVGYKDLFVEVSVVSSPITNVTLGGLPFAASSDLTGGASPYAIEVDYTPGSHGAAFSYEMSIEINPYYVLPSSPASYPRYLSFYLGGVPVRVDAAWDLSRIPADAAKTGNTKTYAGESGVFGFPSYAMIDLGDSFPNVSLGVEVNVKKRDIDKVWINGSSQPYIDIDGYAAEPFGADVSGTTVTLDVLVEFKGDSHKYPLKLKYDNAGVILSYDGSGLYGDVSVRVGNENGGYQTIEGYGLRVFSNIVSAITLSAADRLDGTDGKFFETSYESAESEKLVYSYKHVMDMGKELPSILSVEFGMGAGVKTVSLFGTGADEGVVYKWVRDEEGHIGVEFWNASVSDAIGGMHQRVFNPTQSDYNVPRYEMFFGSDEWTEVYRDSTDEQGYITPSSAISYYASHISSDRIEESYQDRYVTLDLDGAPRIGADERLGGGTYRLYISVTAHAHYKGSVYKTFTITRKDVSSYVTMLVDGARRASGSSSVYRGSAYEIRANAGSYGAEVPFLVNGERAEEITNVHYNASNEVIPYVFAVSVDPANADYFAAAEVTFTIEELLIVNASDVVASVTWNASASTFNVIVMFKDTVLSPDTGLTNGYKISYYKQSDTEHAVTEFTAGEVYFYSVEVKIPNYGPAERHNSVAAI